jgi:hypothetical protein
MTAGVYRDQVEKIDGTWLIRVRHLALDVPF